MEADGAAAHLAWLRESPVVERRLAHLVAPAMLERLGFDCGREVARALLAAYASARTQGRVLTHEFASAAEIQKAVGLALHDLPASCTLTLLMQQADIRGVYRLPLPALERWAVDLLRLDGDSLLVGIDGKPQGLLLDREVDASGRESLTVEVWGCAIGAE